jgi:putative heme-binding domain-containing protein
MCQGLHTRSSVETPWGIVRLNQAGIWRLRPHRLLLQGFYGSEHEPQNPWGFVFTDWGEPIVLAGNNSSPIYAVPGLVVNHRHDPPSLIWKNGNGRKVSGGEIVRTTHFPDSWQGALIVGGYINNAVWALQISDDGAGFLLEDRAPLIKSTSRSFRPVDIRFGPDGALYLCDWFNPIIGHYQASFRHPDRDKTHGRIWRVTAKGRPLTPKPQLGNAPAEELLESLRSTDGWTRHFAKRRLADLPTEPVIAALNNWIRRTDLSEHALKEALGVYQAHEVPAPELLERLCHAADPGARAYAAGVASAWADRLPDPLKLLRPLVTDEHPRVRLQAIVACTYVPRWEAMEAAAAAADHPIDKFLGYALNQAVFALKPYWLPALRSGQLRFDAHPHRLGMMVRADATPDTLEAVRHLLATPGLNHSSISSLHQILAETGQPQDLTAILRVADPLLLRETLPAMVNAARVRPVKPAGAIDGVLDRLLKLNNETIRSSAIELAGLWKVESLRARANIIASNRTESRIVRDAAIRALTAFGAPETVELLKQISRDNTSAQSSAIAALSGLDLHYAAARASEVLAEPCDESSVAEILTAFLLRQKGAAALTAAFENRAPLRENAGIGLKVINRSGRRDDQLARLLANHAGFTSEDRQMNSATLAELVTEVRTDGDARRGQAIYRRAELGCVTCHSIQGDGGKLGPDLSTLGTAQPVDFIVGAILEPQKEIKEGFTSHAVTTRGGEEFQGYLLRESAEEIVLRDVLQNREIRVARKDVADRKSSGSVMPSGLADTLTRAEFRDLVRYLSELGKPGARH